MFSRKDAFADKVKCDECYCWLDKIDAQEIEVHLPLSGNTKNYYCGAHRKPYSRVSYACYGERDYYRMIQVDEKGEPVGYVKAKKKK